MKFGSNFVNHSQKFDQLLETNKDSEKSFLDKNQWQPAFLCNTSTLKKNKKLRTIGKFKISVVTVKFSYVFIVVYNFLHI